MTALNANSKSDTAFLGDARGGGGAAVLTVDLSSHRLDLTNNATYLQELASARTALSTPREITAYFEADDNDAGILINHGNALGTAYTYRVFIKAGAVEVYENGVLLASLDLPNVSPVDRAYALQWSTRMDGSISAQSELTICDVTGGEYAHAFFRHTPASTSAAYAFNVCGYGAGVSAFPIAKVLAVRIGRRFHSSAEFKEDWIAATTPPTIGATLRDPPLPLTADVEQSTEAAFAGPAYLWSGYNTRQSDRRLVSPVANLRIIDAALSAGILDNTFATPRQRYMRAWHDSRYRFAGQTIVYRPISPKTNKVRARVSVRAASVGANPPVDMQFTLYSIAGFPFAGEAKKPKPVYYYTTPVSVNVNTGLVAVEGEWIDLGETRIAVDDWGCSLFVLAMAFDLDSGSADADDTRVILQALTIDPFYEVSDNGYAGGFDLSLP